MKDSVNLLEIADNIVPIGAMRNDNFRRGILEAMKEACRQTLELAAGNAKILNSKGELSTGISAELYPDELNWEKETVDYMISKQSITDTINQVQ